MKKSLLLDFFIADINMHFININTKIFKEFVKLYSEKIYLFNIYNFNINFSTIPEGGSNKVAIDIMTTKIQTLVSKQ